MSFFLLVYFLAGPTVRPARAQSFGPPVPTELVLVLLDREGSVRFTLASYYTAWENPFRLTVTTFSPGRASLGLPGAVSQTYRLVANTPASPLVEGNYVLTRRWSVGFWYNPIRGERLRTMVMPAELPVDLNLTRDTDLGDIHVIYYGHHGLSAQVGYYHEHGTIQGQQDDVQGTRTLRRNYTLVSWNAWLTQRLDLFTHSRLTSDRLDAHLIPFVSFGYHASSGLNHATSVLTGVAVTFGEKISLSGSVWLFDLRNTATRITGGLVIQY
jgi:hypothetical protein